MCFSLKIVEGRAVSKSSNSGKPSPCCSGLMEIFLNSSDFTLMMLFFSDGSILADNTLCAYLPIMQLNFFRKGLKCLEAVEPRVKMVTEEQRIDYQFSGLEDDGEDGEDDGADVCDAREDGESSFDYRQDSWGLNVVSQSKNSMEVSI